MYCNRSCSGKDTGGGRKRGVGQKRDKKFDRQYGAYLVWESMASISRRMGLSRSAVGRAFRRRDFKKRSKWIANLEQRALIRIMYATGDHTQAELAKCFGYQSYVSIGQIIRRDD